MGEEKTYKALSSLFIFDNVSEDRVCELIAKTSPEVKQFKQGELIYSPEEFSKKIGFVLSGTCTVERQRADGTPIPLNLLGCGDAFGVLSVFSDGSEFPTYIKAKKDATVLFFDKKDVLYLVENEPKTAINIMYFMGNRIAFLNNKLSTFSADNIEQKVAKFLLFESKKLDSLTFVLNFKKTSESLNIGRASLYRAFDILTREGILNLDNKKINITDLEGLERIAK